MSWKIWTFYPNFFEIFISSGFGPEFWRLFLTETRNELITRPSIPRHTEINDL